VSRDGPVGGLGGPLAEQDLRADELLAAPLGAGPRHPQRPPSPQARGQLTAQRAAALDVQGLVDRLVRDPHGPIIGEVDPESVGDLLRAPRPGPAPVRAAPVTPPNPTNLGTWHRRAVGRGDPAGEPVLHVLAQRVVGGELGQLRAPGAPVGMPLRRRGAIVQTAAAGRGVTAQLPRDRCGVSAEPARDLAHPDALGSQDCDLFALRERKVATRQRSQTGRWHPATLPEPPPAHRRRHTARHRGVLARQPAGDRLPEPLPMLTPRHRRPTR
jgi:hypothetical protein